MYSPFGQLKNKMLITGETNDSGSVYSGTLATYEYMGGNNANILVNDTFG